MKGKFASLKDKVVYDASAIADRDFAAQGEWFALLLDFHGKHYIIHESDQGFVDVDVFTSIIEAEAEWKVLEDAFLPEYDDEYV